MAKPTTIEATTETVRIRPGQSIEIGGCVIHRRSGDDDLFEITKPAGVSVRTPARVRRDQKEGNHDA